MSLASTVSSLFSVSIGRYRTETALFSTNRQTATSIGMLFPAFKLGRAELPQLLKTRDDPMATRRQNRHSVWVDQVSALRKL
jgi:hypothetical protein